MSLEKVKEFCERERELSEKEASLLTEHYGGHEGEWHRGYATAMDNVLNLIELVEKKQCP